MSPELDHERVRERQDRSATMPLLERIRSAAAGAGALGTGLAEDFRTLAYLEDYRSIGPLTAMVEDTALPRQVREQASQVLAGFDDTATGARCRAWWASGDEVVRKHALRLMERPEADIVTAVAADDAHPLQAAALDAMAFGYDEAQFQPVKIRPLRHRDETVRLAAAEVLIWDEAVAAEEPLLAAVSDPSAAVAVAAADALQYYPSRRVLRALADLRGAGDPDLRSQATESFDSVRASFGECARQIQADHPGQAGLLRRWMEPVADLVPWPDAVPRERGEPHRPVWTLIPEHDIMAMLEDADGEWAATMDALRSADWAAYPEPARRRLAPALTGHPDPVIRATAARALAAWHRTGDLLALTSDPSATTRQYAMYELRFVPPDPAVARRARDVVAETGGILAREALQTYVAHAPAGEAGELLAGLAAADRHDSVRATAVECLAGLGAARELADLAPLLTKPPTVSWSVHDRLLAAFGELHLPVPALRELVEADNANLYVAAAAIALGAAGAAGAA